MRDTEGNSFGKQIRHKIRVRKARIDLVRARAALTFKNYKWPMGFTWAELDSNYPGKELVVAFNEPYTGLHFKGVIAAFAWNVEKKKWKHLWTYKHNSYGSDLITMQLNGEDHIVGSTSHSGPSEDEKKFLRKHMFCLNKQGDPVWETQLLDPKNGEPYNAYMLRGIEVGDILKSNPGKEVVFVGGSNMGPFNGGEVVIVDAATGKILMRDNINRPDDMDPSAANWIFKLQSVKLVQYLNKKTKGILVTGGHFDYGNITLLRVNQKHKKCKRRWRNQVGVCSMDVSLSTDGKRIAVPSTRRLNAWTKMYWTQSGSWDGLTLLDIDGNIIWRKPLGNHPWTVLFADINNDGQDEIIVGIGAYKGALIKGTRVNGAIAVYDLNGKLLGIYHTPEAIVYRLRWNAEEGILAGNCTNGKVYLLKVSK
jgi:hypothetical protein